MTSNPYQSPAVDSGTSKTKKTWWLIWAGMVMIAGAALAIIVAVTRVFTLFHGEVDPTPMQLAQRISAIQISVIVAVPLGVIGLAMIISGLLIRRPTE